MDTLDWTQPSADSLFFHSRINPAISQLQATVQKEPEPHVSSSTFSLSGASGCSSSFESGMASSWIEHLWSRSSTSRKPASFSHFLSHRLEQRTKISCLSESCRYPPALPDTPWIQTLLVQGKLLHTGASLPTWQQSRHLGCTSGLLPEHLRPSTGLHADKYLACFPFGLSNCRQNALHGTPLCNASWMTSEWILLRASANLLPALLWARCPSPFQQHRLAKLSQTWRLAGRMPLRSWNSSHHWWSSSQCGRGSSKLHHGLPKGAGQGWPSNRPSALSPLGS